MELELFELPPSLPPSLLGTAEGDHVCVCVCVCVQRWGYGGVGGGGSWWEGCVGDGAGDGVCVCVCVWGGEEVVVNIGVHIL